MKFKLFLSLIILIIIGFSCTDRSRTEYLEDLKQHRENINREFADTVHSPLTAEGLMHFEGLDFFPGDPDWVIEAQFIPNPDPEPFEMETTTTRRPIYVKYGEARFKLNGVEHVLEIYQSEKAKQMEKKAA